MEPEQPRWLPRYNKNKHELDLWSMNLTVDDIQDIIQSVHIDHQQLKMIDLGWNKIHSEGLKRLKRKLAQPLNTQFKYIFQNLADNQIGDQGCKCLSLANWPNLQTIGLERNNIGDSGCKYLSLSDWSNLQTLSLNQNNIRDQGCKYLSQANWLNLQILGLGDNKISDKGFRLLIAFKWQNLKTLRCYYNTLINQDFLKNYVRFVQIRNQNNERIDIVF